MELFAKIVNGLKPMTIFAKISILDIWLGFDHSSSNSLIGSFHHGFKHGFKRFSIFQISARFLETVIKKQLDSRKRGFDLTWKLSLLFLKILVIQFATLFESPLSLGLLLVVVSVYINRYRKCQKLVKLSLFRFFPNNSKTLMF